MNLVSTIMQLLGPVIINRIAGSLGLNQGIAGKALAAAVPAILAALTGAASRSAGANQLSDTLARQDTSILGNLTNLLGGSDQTALVDKGTDALSSLLGGGATNALSAALARFTGIDTSKSRSLAGLASSVVLSQLAQTQRSSGLDANGLASLLKSQKSNVAAAMPPGFANLLDGSGLLDSLGDTPMRPVAAAPEPSSTIGKWLLPLALALLGVYVLSSYGCNPSTHTTTPAVEPPSSTTAPESTTTPTDVVGLASAAISALNSTLGGVTDEASAQAALPTLEQAASQIDSVKTAAAHLSSEAKAPLAKVIADALPGLTAAIEKATGIPGVATILNPVLQPVLANLDTLAKT